VAQYSVGKGISMPLKKVPDRRSDLRPSEKEVPERRPGAFRHKNTPVTTTLYVGQCLRSVFD
jgi:hypothetical protein